ncbi:tyrosine-type recombinase/integrase [Thioclava sp. 15-R06ZXC-3]|uniref:Tyrosine-type recombinase/integrase n=1 Tax=Thioclava arctica TaxID=3238301 RepID=A0ABV3TPS6_9RHOB
MRAHPEPLRNLRNRVATLGDLRDRVSLELVAEIAFAHLGLLASKLGKKASTNLGAIQIAASEGGLAPQDIGILTRDHVQNTPKGRRLLFKRLKSKKVTRIPVTPALAKLIDETPNEQKQLIVSLDGRRLQPERASGIVRDLKARANAAAATNTTLYHIRDELRLYDMRGTAATELLRAGCSLNEIAVTMGWGLRHAANIIEKYAAIVPEVADEVLAKLTAARRESEDSK